MIVNTKAVSKGGLVAKRAREPLQNSLQVTSSLVVCQAKFAGFVVSASALKSRTKVLTTNLFTHQI